MNFTFNETRIGTVFEDELIDESFVDERSF